MQKRLIWIGILAALVALMGCNRTYDPVPEHVDRIFPLEEGQRKVFQVIDTAYRSSVTDVAVDRYFKRETYEGTENDLLNREVTRVRLDRTPDDLTPGPPYDWSFHDLWTEYLGDDYAERIEGNTRYLVLRIPPLDGTTWDGNLFNGQDVQQYRYANTDTTVTVGDVTYEQCVVVIQVPYRKLGSSSSFVEIEEYTYEVYAPNIGKIMRYDKYLEIQRDNTNDQGTIQDRSHVHIETLVSHQ